MSAILSTALLRCGDAKRLEDLATSDEAMREAEKAAEVEEVDLVDALRCAGVI